MGQAAGKCFLDFCTLNQNKSKISTGGFYPVDRIAQNKLTPPEVLKLINQFLQMLLFVDGERININFITLPL